ncbi:hypothetical protein [Diaminobutyricibacter sp. McL0608]|uniref:hypothetical protein n=1 Tax=Leifsonia sp. McL0608 TaxID=3143537 RepID=UPI0031F30D2C
MKHGRVIAVIMAVASIAMLAGCSAPVAPHTSAPIVAAPSPTPTPTPAATGPTVRVHATCAELVSTATIEQVTGVSLSPVAWEHTTSAASYGSARIGSLQCEWSNQSTASAADSVTVLVTIAPNATRDEFQSFLSGESGGGTPSTVGPDTYLMGAKGSADGFVFLTDDYGASGFIAHMAPIKTQATAAQSLLERVYGVVSSLAAPDPMWKPIPDLRGTTDCDGLATAEQLAATVGLADARAVKSDDGEYSSSLFNTDRQVGGYNCIWDSDTSSNASVSVVVLPGGAVYATQVRTNVARNISGLGDSAFFTRDGKLNVIAADGWVQVGATGATDAQLVALARAVLTNNGYTQGNS